MRSVSEVSSRCRELWKPRGFVVRCLCQLPVPFFSCVETFAPPQPEPWLRYQSRCCAWSQGRQRCSLSTARSRGWGKASGHHTGSGGGRGEILARGKSLVKSPGPQRMWDCTRPSPWVLAGVAATAPGCFCQFAVDSIRSHVFIYNVGNVFVTNLPISLS